jgi:addiction module RelE/StbE family toxin
MQIGYHRNCKKAFRKQTEKSQQRFFEKLDIFAEDQFHYSLNSHALDGKFLGMRSFDVTGDIKVHYKEEGVMVVLMNIGSHSQLY